MGKPLIGASTGADVGSARTGALETSLPDLSAANLSEVAVSSDTVLMKSVNRALTETSGGLFAPFNSVPAPRPAGPSESQ